MTQPLEASIHNGGDKILDTYVWQAKNNQEDMQVYDVDVVYGADTFPPVGFEKCNKTLTPQLPSESQSFLCYRTINEGDKESIEQRALEMMTSALSISATANETKTSFALTGVTS